MGSLLRDVWRRSLTVIFMVDIGNRALCIKFNFNAMFDGWGDRFNRDVLLNIKFLADIIRSNRVNNVKNSLNQYGF